MPIAAAAAVVGSAAIGASAQSKAAKKAANATVAAADQATALSAATYNDQRNLTTPAIAAGAQARARQMHMQGIPKADIIRYLQSTASAIASPTVGQVGPNGGMGANNRNGFLNAEGQYEQPGGPVIDAQPGEDYSWLDQSYEANSPGYQWRKDEGQKALERSAAARGGLFSGGTGRELERYGSEFAKDEFAADFSRFGQIAGDGTDAANTTVNVAGQFGNAASQNAIRAGDARASGYVNQGNIWGNLAGQVGGAIGMGFGTGQQKGWFG